MNFQQSLNFAAHLAGKLTKLEPAKNMTGHGKIVCSCGDLIAQCRCMESHRNVEVRQNACEKCKNKANKAHATEVPIEEYEARVKQQ